VSAPVLRLGTRASALALAQTATVADALRADGVEVEVVTVTTLGDRGAAVEDKSRWVSELERALDDGRIDVALHSAKDVPTELAPGMELVAVPPRADARDALCGAAGLDALASGARVGTASLRRTAQINAFRDDLQVVELRGNVDSRLRKLAEHQVDALVLALAGLQRLGRSDAASATIEEFVPAAGQGALALEARTGEIEARRLHAVSDPVAMACLTAERTLVHALNASCHTPVGAHARPVDAEATELELVAWVGLPDGSQWLRDTVSGAPDEVGDACARRMLAAGARELLDRAEAEAEAEPTAEPV
jgi:hydroxymethylbilane synthase